MIELLSGLILVTGLGFLLGYRLGYRRGDVAGFAKTGCKICFERGEEKGRKDAVATWSEVPVKVAKNKKKSIKRKASK